MIGEKTEPGVSKRNESIESLVVSSSGKLREEKREHSLYIDNQDMRKKK